MLISTFFNRPFRILLVTQTAKAVGQELPFNVMPYMTAWVIGEKCIAAGDFFAYLVLVNLVCGVATTIPWMCLARRLGKYAAFLWFNIALALTSLSFITVFQDDGSCGMTGFLFLLSALFGGAYGGGFLIKDMVTDIVDYDEMLTGGRRREASYMMAIEFVPKFMNIPGECVPFLLMAYYSYSRPLEERKACAGSTGLGDDYCAKEYTNEPTGSNWCSDTLSCQEYLANGVTFVCNDALERCGLYQNESVVWVLRLSFSIVPFICVMAGVIALRYYPKPARTEEIQEKLHHGVSELKRGRPVEDPMRAGCWIYPAEEYGTFHGALSYFTPNELRLVIEDSPSTPGSKVVITPLLKWLTLYVVIFSVLLAVGIVLMIFGFEDMGSDLGASVSPLGLMVFGIGLVGFWFNAQRGFAARYLMNNSVPRLEVIRMYNSVCPFIGATRMEVGTPESSASPMIYGKEGADPLDEPTTTSM